MRRAIVGLLVVAGLLVALDRAAWWFAEREVAGAIARAQGPQTRPDVSLHGFPVLTQAVAGTYRQVDVLLHGVPTPSGARLAELDTRLTGVHLPLASAVYGSARDARVDRVRATGRIGFDELNRVVAERLDSRQLQLRLAPASRGRLLVTGRYSGTLLEVTIRSQARLTIRRGRLRATLLPETVDQLPLVVRTELDRLVGDALDLPVLPAGLSARTVEVGRDGVAVTAEGRNVLLGDLLTGAGG